LQKLEQHDSGNSGEHDPALDSNQKAPFFLYLHAVDPHAPYSPPERFKRLFLGLDPDPGPDAPLTRKGEFLEILLWLDQFKDWKPEKEGQKFRFDYQSERLNFRASQIERSMPMKELSRAYLDFYGKDDPLLRQRVDYLIALYNAEVAFADDNLDKFLKQLEYKGMLDNTVVVVTSDHGEALLEHDIWGHGNNVYQEAIRIPFIFRIPSRQGVVRGGCDEPVSLVDIYPTVLDLLGLSLPERLSGVSLWPVMESRDESNLKRRPIFSEMIKQHQEHVAVILGHRKLVRIANESEEAAWQYFDLDADPSELLPILPEAWDADVRALRKLLEGYLRTRAIDFNRKGERVEPSEEEIQQLRALGYI
ncbi:MAG: sulfatase-like hydrolase/transferase, partial [Planctomycetota bacterium]